MIDNRVVLPLSKVERVGLFWCARHCPALGEHREECLIPHLAERTRMLCGPKLSKVVQPDCRDGKCSACPGCAHECHRYRLPTGEVQGCP